MYDMYPEWGPAAHDPEHPLAPPVVVGALQAALDQRDNSGERPDDN